VEADKNSLDCGATLNQSPDLYLLASHYCLLFGSMRIPFAEHQGWNYTLGQPAFTAGPVSASAADRTPTCDHT
jgi:hypothetical protein